MTIYFFYDTAYMVTKQFQKIFMVTTKNYYHYASDTGPQAVGSSLEKYLTIMGQRMLK
jgi:hypothetical protein